MPRLIWGSRSQKQLLRFPPTSTTASAQATKDAGKIAGLDVLRIINEPTAASLAFGLDKQTAETILVFDLGGGTFDVSVLEVGDGVVEVKATSGDTHLGGDDWDQVIVDWIADEFMANNNIDLRKDRQALQRLREAAESAKIELSSAIQTEINLPFITADASGPRHLQLNLTRARLEQLSTDLMKRLAEPVEQALVDAGIEVSAINEIVLVGGATRMPMVQDFVQSRLGKTPNKSVNPDEVVAIGAALQAGVLAGEVSDILLLDVAPLSLGIETLAGVMTPLIERNTTIPVSKSEVFSTAADNQTAVDIHVLQGERPMVVDNMTLGNFRLDGIPSSPRGVPQVEVMFDIDANGILNVTATNKADGRAQNITVTASTNLTNETVERLVNEARQHQADDESRHQLVQARNEADTLIYQAEKALTDLGEQIPANDRATIESQIQAAKQALEGDDRHAIGTTTEALRNATYALSQQATAHASSDESGGSHRSGQAQPDEDIVEGDFTEA